MAIGRRYADWLYGNRVDSLVAHMDADSKSRPATATELADASGQIMRRAGVEEKVLELLSLG